jgi:hypothetical protein
MAQRPIPMKGACATATDKKANAMAGKSQRSTTTTAKTKATR